jgi:hypothetical protein
MEQRASASAEAFEVTNARAGSSTARADTDPSESIEGTALVVDSVRLWQFSPLDFALLVAVAAGYLLGGYLAFQVATRRARRLGVLGDY